MSERQKTIRIEGATYRNFVYRKKGSKNKISQKVVDFFKDEEDSVMAVLGDVNKGVSRLEVLYTSVIESMLSNREMNMLLFTFILNI